MSYGLDLSLPETYIEECHQLAFSNLNSDWPEMPLPYVTQRKRLITSEILKLNLGSDNFSGSDGYIELNHDNGIQVGIFDHEVGISIPYWYGDTEVVQMVFNDIQKIVIAIENVTKYQTHDPQVGKIINIRQDLDTMIMAYLWTTNQMRQILPHIYQD